MLEGASWEQDCLALTDEVGAQVGAFALCWRRKNSTKDKRQGVLEVPFYRSSTRTALLFTAEMEADPKVPLRVWRERATAIILWRGELTV